MKENMVAVAATFMGKFCLGVICRRETLFMSLLLSHFNSDGVVLKIFPSVGKCV